MTVELEDFKTFFVGNLNNAGKQYKNKNGDVLWFSGTIKKRFGENLTINDILQQHLNKKITIGSYPYYKIAGDSTWYCKFILIDIDDHKETEIDKIIAKLNMRSLTIMRDFIKHYKIPTNNILRDFSGRGYHIWVKLAYQTTLKRAWDLKKDIENRLLKIHGIEEEIFPKQNESTLTKFGNCCKLPLSINLNNGQYCDILDGFDLSKQGSGYKIPEWILKATYQKKSHNNFTPKNIIQNPIMEVHNECFDWFLGNIKPCLKAIALGTIETHSTQGDNGHLMNISLCNALHYIGAPLEVRIKAFEKQPKFDYTKTKNYILGLSKGFKRKYAETLTCNTIQKRGFCLRDITGGCHNE